ncbi:unnamed protein product [Onchocerca ochengi]|uniref:ATP-dependent DNA helicase n=1 Tax=Onchocerca ochengi TaxID=42157 RepID=A0A182EZZ4_ONCOC|nr:unnamed protein product [Onchocerca ochengi]
MRVQLQNGRLAGIFSHQLLEIRNGKSNYKNHEWLSERVMLAARNKDVDELGNIILTFKARQSHISPSTLLLKQMKWL